MDLKALGLILWSARYCGLQLPALLTVVGLLARSSGSRSPKKARRPWTSRPKDLQAGNGVLLPLFRVQPCFF